jgi:hypothetical protein
MRAVGIIATTIAGAIAVVAAVTGIRSIGDIKRYLKIRAM